MSRFEPGTFRLKLRHVDHLTTAKHKAESPNIFNHCVKILNAPTHPTQNGPLAVIFTYPPSHGLTKTPIISQPTLATLTYPQPGMIDIRITG